MRWLAAALLLTLGTAEPQVAQCLELQSCCCALGTLRLDGDLESVVLSECRLSRMTMCLHNVPLAFEALALVERVLSLMCCIF